MLSFPSSSVSQPSLVDWLLGTLEMQGPQTLNELGGRLPETNWAQLLLAVDYSSRNGQVSLTWVPRGDYVVSLSKGAASPEAALQEPHTELVGARTV